MKEHQAAALATLALPGMRFLHDGQLQGAKMKTPVQLGRRIVEPAESEVAAMYRKLGAVLKQVGVGEVEGRILHPTSAWEGNASHQDILLIQWSRDSDPLTLIVINLAKHRSQCRVPLALPSASDRKWSLIDLLGTERWVRVGKELETPGLFLDLAPHAAQVFLCRPVDLASL